MKNINKLVLGGLLTVSCLANAGEVTPFVSLKLNQTHADFKATLYYNDYSETMDGFKGNFYGVSVGGGAKYNLNEQVFVGGELNVNFNGKQTDKDDGKITYNFQQLLDLNLIAGYNITKEVNVYALVGGAYSTFGVKEEDSDFKTKAQIVPQFGLGTGYTINKNLAVKLEYLYTPTVKFKDNNKNFDIVVDFKTNSIQKISLGVNYNF